MEKYRSKYGASSPHNPKRLTFDADQIHPNFQSMDRRTKKHKRARSKCLSNISTLKRSIHSSTDNRNMNRTAHSHSKKRSHAKRGSVTKSKNIPSSNLMGLYSSHKSQKSKKNRDFNYSGGMLTTQHTSGQINQSNAEKTFLNKKTHLKLARSLYYQPSP